LESRESYLEMSANFMPAYLLNLIGINNSFFMAYLNDLYEQGLKILPNKGYYEELDIDVDSIEEYKLLQYDLLFGNRYVYAGEKLQEKDSYSLGYGDLMISNIVIDSNESILRVKGRGFTKSSVAYVNEQQMETLLLDDSNLQAVIPNGYLDKSKEIEVSIKIIDSLNRILVESNKLITTVVN
jgi:hypothetical protein